MFHILLEHWNAHFVASAGIQQNYPMNIESFFIKTVGEGAVNLTPLKEEDCYKSPFPQGISADDWIPDVSELDPLEDDEPSTNSKDDHPIPEHVFQFIKKNCSR